MGTLLGIESVRLTDDTGTLSLISVSGLHIGQRGANRNKGKLLPNLVMKWKESLEAISTSFGAEA